MRFVKPQVVYLLAPACVALALALTSTAAQAAEAANAPPAPPAEPAAAELAVPTTDAAAMPDVGDQAAPIITDIAAAVADPSVPPVISVSMTDQDGVGEAFVYFQAPGTTEWIKAPLQGAPDGKGGLYIARLPDGLQRSGFSYYVEAFDIAGNGPSRLGSPTSPIVADKARGSTRDDMQTMAQTDEVFAIHPLWPMLALGTGILGAAGTGIFAIDLGVSKARQDDAIAKLENTTDADKRAALKKTRDSYGDAVFLDTALVAVLGVVAVAGLATGVSLLVLMNIE